MDTKSESNKRKVGGFGFASSMIRSNIDTEGYLKHIVYVINLRLFGNEEVLTYRVESAGFEILAENESVLIGEIDFIEHCRSISVTEFERKIIDSLITLGYKFDTNSDYYHAVIK